MFGGDDPRRPDMAAPRQLDHLAECALTGREPIVSGEEGLKDMRLIEAIYRAARDGTRVKLA